MKNKFVQLISVAVLGVTLGTVPANASMFTDLTEDKVNDVKQELASKKLKVNTIKSSTSQLKDVVEDLGKKTEKLTTQQKEIIKQKQAIQDELNKLKAEKEKVAKEKAVAKAKAEAEALAKQQAEAKAKAEAEAKAQQEAEAQAKTEAEAEDSAQTTTATVQTASVGGLQFGADGLLVESASGNAQQVINLLLGIPGHANGASYHASTGLDSLIDSLSVPEAVYVIHRIEGAGFGQTGAGAAGYDAPSNHQLFVNQQVNGRFGGSIHALLKAWGTFSYGGY